MKRFFLVALAASVLLASCSLFRSNKKGCPSNGANVGAERILSGDPKAAKDLKKGKKYRMNKF
ncbi:MAG TPA: hypothetical protein VF145_01380 [Chitinophagaceae bacterium]